MADEEVALTLLEDREGRRNPAVRWLTGQPGDALLFLSADKKSLLFPWDMNMAKKYASADNIIPYTDFDCKAEKAFLGAVSELKTPLGSRIEIPSSSSHPTFLRYEKNLAGFDLLCREDGLDAHIAKLRAIKDEEEIRVYRKLSSFTDELIDLLTRDIGNRLILTEVEAALFIESEARKRGCEGVSFETLAAGPARSFGIHAFPAYTSAAFAEKGLSILDFGLKYEGYASDVTMTFANNASPKQEKQLSLVKDAYDLAFSMVKTGVFARDIAKAVDDLYQKEGKILPHGLGHGVGLEIHEAPYLRSKSENPWELQAGMIFTIEPGVYDPLTGGCRFENDILLTETGAEALTHSRVVRI